MISLHSMKNAILAYLVTFMFCCIKNLTAGVSALDVVDMTVYCCSITVIVFISSIILYCKGSRAV